MTFAASRAHPNWILMLIIFKLRISLARWYTSTFPWNAFIFCSLIARLSLSRVADAPVRRIPERWLKFRAYVSIASSFRLPPILFALVPPPVASVLNTSCLRFSAPRVCLLRMNDKCFWILITVCDRCACVRERQLQTENCNQYACVVVGGRVPAICLFMQCVPSYAIAFCLLTLTDLICSRTHTNTHEYILLVQRLMHQVDSTRRHIVHNMQYATRANERTENAHIFTI